MMLDLSEITPIRHLCLKHARDAFVSDDEIRRQWRKLHYTEPPDYHAAVEEYEAFADLLRGMDIQISFLDPGPGSCLDSIYVRDAAVVTGAGIVLCSMSKPARQAEPAFLRQHCLEHDIPIAGAITGNGRLEGGDLVWFDADTAAVGIGYRSNSEGIRQLCTVLDDRIRELVTVPLPHWRGPSDVFHLMSIISPIDRDLALVYSPLMPVPFRQWLQQRGIVLVEVPETEFHTLGCNVLAVAPRRCIAVAGNPVTRRRLERAGVEVLEYGGKEISLKGQGGPTCLTRPILREDA